MSSIIRWRKGETLRAIGMGYPNGVTWLLMESNDIETDCQKEIETRRFPGRLTPSGRANSREAG